MSWMDSWSRPTKHATTPPPLYLTQPEDSIPYCHTCGRVISRRRTQSATANNVVKYCSDRCKHHKPGSLDKRIEEVFVRLLNGQDGGSLASEGEVLSESKPQSKITTKKKPAKGDPRIIVDCNDVETIVFGKWQDPEKVYGRKKNRATRAIGAKDKDKDGEWKSVDMEDTDESVDDNEGPEAPAVPPPPQQPRDARVEAIRGFGAGKTRPPQTEDEVNFSVGGERGRAEKIEETPEALAKRLEGQRRTEEREMIRRAARRGCAFGFLVRGWENTGDGTEDPKSGKKKKARGAAQSAGVSDGESAQTERRRKCEALMSGSVVESSFAKGDWSIRWRE